MASASPTSIRLISELDMLSPSDINGGQRVRWCGDARQPVVQGCSFSGFRTAQMCLIRSPATLNAITTTVTPSC